MCKSFHIVRRCIVLFLVLVFLVTAGACSTTPTVESFPSKAATMNADPVSVVSPVSVPLSGEWSFSVDKDNSGEQQGWTTSNSNDSSWVSVQVPHTWNVMPEYSEYEGFAWYRRTFTAPLELQNSHVRLKFDAVFYLARVWLNGQYLGQHE